MVGAVQSGWLEQKLAEGVPLAQIIIDQTRQSFGAYTFVPDRSAWYDPKIALLDSVSAVLLVLGVALALVNWRRSEWFLPIAWLTGAAVLGGMLLVNTPESPRYVTTAPALCLLVMLALQRIAMLTGQALQWTDRRALLSAVLVVLLAAWNLNFLLPRLYPAPHIRLDEHRNRHQTVALCERATGAGVSLYVHSAAHFSSGMEPSASSLPALRV